jgi:hypothetical protein
MVPAVRASMGMINIVPPIIALSSPTSVAIELIAISYNNSINKDLSKLDG